METEKMKHNLLFVCSFDTTSDLRGKNRTYENIKTAALAAGRFSTFDVTTAKDGRMFTALLKDPEVEVFDLPYPWTGVRRAQKEDVNVKEKS